MCPFGLRSVWRDDDDDYDGIDDDIDEDDDATSETRR